MSKTVKLYTQKLNKRKQQFEPGELIWEVSYYKDPSSNTLIFDKDKEIPVGDYFLVFPFENELHAEPLHAETGQLASRLNIRRVI